MAETKVLLCTCKHPYQDNMYGEGNRVHNEFTKGWTCTVCDKEKITQKAPTG